MNKTCYKVIFNKKRGMMMAVAENTTRDGKNVQDSEAAVSDGLSQGAAKFQMHTAAFSVLLAVGSAAVSPVWAAGISTDKSAPLSQQPTVLQTANGLPQVNIQTPSAGGVSVNQYRQFDVDKRGAILNNSRSNVQTQQAGWIQGNPWLARGEAKVIVNQVNSVNPSLLNGYVEVAGRRADVVLANPAGIQVNGAGFINAAGVTLTTGKPLFDNGNLSGFQVRDGHIAINGGGLDTSSADYTRLLARAAQINAGVWAKDLSVVSGSNDVAADGSHTQVSDGRPAPAVAIDTAQLGGMYANKITLVSTDKGSAIHHAGQAFATAGGVTLSADGKIGNSGSMVAADNTQRSGAAAGVNIQATAFDNSGTVSAQGKTAIQSPNVSNSGLITSSDELHIRTQNLDNSQTIQAARFDIETGRLNNSGNMAQTGLQSLNIEAGKLNNSGLIGYAEQDHASNNGSNASPAAPAAPSTATGAGSTQSQSQTATAPLSLTQGRLNVSDDLNNSGTLTANDGIELSTQNSLANSGKLHLGKLNAQGALLDNREGEIITRQAEMTAQTLDNRQGSLTATESFAFKGQTLNNHEGNLQSGGTLSATTDTFDNSHGKLTVNQQADIKTATLSNQNGQIDTGRLKAEAARLDNTAGQIRSDELTELKVSDGLNNQSGLIGSAKNIRIHDGNQQTLALNNASGEILAGQNLDIQAQTLAKQGTLAANQNLSLKLKDSFTAEQDIRAGQGLHISSEGDLNNSYTLEGGRFVLLEAENINHTSTGVIQSGSDTRIKAKNLTNRGLINSNGLTLLDAGETVLNIGTGRVYGDWVGIEADKLVNREEDKGAVIAAREHLAVGAKEIVNQEHAKLNSEGSLSIGGSLDEQHQAEGAAAKLDNNGAEIQSQGDMHIAADVLLNRNSNYRSSHQEVPGSRKQVTEYVLADRAYNFNEDHGLTTYTDEDVSHFAGYGSLVLKNGSHHEDYMRTRYTQYDVETVVDSSNPGRIVSGGNLTIASKDPTNDKSHILAAGTLYTPVSAIKNLDDDTAKSIRMKIGASRHWHLVTHSKGKIFSGNSGKTGRHDYRPAPADAELVKTPNFRLNVVKTESHYQGDTAVATVSQAKLEGTNIQPSGSTPAPIKTLNTDTKLPTSSLYAVNPANPSYLVETDPAFANYKQWLGSDYMLNALNLDPSHMHKRLGDGYYEQKLVNEQVARLTGYRRLDGYSNDEEQFKALMEAGITFAREQQLTPGIRLSAEQIARLTSDIVWLETQTLTLIDGSTVDVLAPKVYLTVKPGDINAHGGLISADKLALDGAGSIVNSGTLAGRKIVDLSATDIQNSGVVQGGKVRLRGQDVNIEGGTVEADTLLAVEADRIRVASTTATGGDERNGQTQIDRVAGLYVNNASDGLLSLKANESIDFVAANLRNEAAKGKTQIVSDGRIDLGTAKLESHGKRGELSDKNHRHITQTSEAGTAIRAAGDILISAKEDLTVRQGSIESDNGRTTLSGRNVSITEGRQTLDLDESVYSKSSGFASKKTSLDQYRRQHDEAAGSSIKGKEVVVQAEQDVNVRGSNVVSDGRTVLKAGNDVNITAAENTYADHEFHERKRSGLSGGFKDGVLSVGVGKQQRSIDADARKTTAALTDITALSGDTVISAGNRLRSEGASVSAAQDILLQGKQVVLDAAYNAESETVHTQSKESGIRANINLKAAEVRQLQKLAEGAKNAASESGAQNRLRAWDQGQLSSAAEPFMPAVNFSAGRSRSQSQDKLHTLTPVGSRVNAGGDVVIKATEGDVNIIGSQVYGAQNTWIDAFGDVGITEATGNTDRSAQSNSKTSGLMSGDSSFSLFAGNKTERSGEQSGRSNSVGSVVGSGSGDTVIRAGKTYTQSGSQLLADGDISVDAQKIDIRAAQSPYHSDFYSNQTQKGITAGFSSPVTDAVGSVQKLADSRAQVGQSSNGRTNAMAAANTGWQAYQAAQSVEKAMDSKGGGINVNITYGEQRNESESHIRGTESGGSTVVAGGIVRLNAAGAGKDSDLTVIGSDVAGKGGTVLLAENNINLLASEQNHSERSSNSQRGWNAGVALDFSNGVSVGFTGGGNYGKGYGNGDEQTYRTTRIGSSNSQTVIQSGGDTTLKGAQVKGRGVALSAENLRIESLQDSAAYNSRQFQGSGQITVGYGFSGSADYSQSKINADHRSISEQSGIYAGDDGFQVDVSNHTDLKGGIITSTETAEQNGRNRFQTATLTQSDLQNHSRFEGESFGLGVSGGMSGEALGQEQNSRLKTVQPENGSSMGYGRDGDSQSSVTRSGIGTRNIVITNDTTGEQAKAVYTDTRTETAEANSGRLNNAFDKNEVQREIDLQRNVSQDFSRNVQQARTEINRKAESHKELAKAAENKAAEALQKGDLAAYREAVQTANEHHQKADNWQKGGVALAAVATGLSAPTDSALGITAATASPVAAYQIGQYFKGVAAQNSDGRLTAAQETARIVAHGVIAAATAAAGDSNALTAAISAGGAEAAAPYVSQWLYGEKDGSKLTAEQKQTVSSILSLGGAAVGAAANGSAADMVAGGQAAQTAVENNFEAILTPKEQDYLSSLGSFAQSSLAYHHGDIALMIKDMNEYGQCKGNCEINRDVKFFIDGSSQVVMTFISGGAVIAIRGVKAAHHLNTLRKVTQNEKAIAFTINGTANATISAIANEENRNFESAVYNFIVGGTAGTVAARMPTVKKNMAAQGVVYGSGELAKHTLYGTNEIPPSTGDILFKTGIVASGGILGGYMGNRASKAARAYTPKAPLTAQTSSDAIAGSVTSNIHVEGINYIIKTINNNNSKRESGGNK